MENYIMFFICTILFYTKLLVELKLRNIGKITTILFTLWILVILLVNILTETFGILNTTWFMSVILINCTNIMYSFLSIISTKKLLKRKKYLPYEITNIIVCIMMIIYISVK